MCTWRDLKKGIGNNKVLTWLITVSAADSWRIADILSPNFLLILIELCEVVAWPFFTIHLLGCLPASVPKWDSLMVLQGPLLHRTIFDRLWLIVVIEWNWKFLLASDCFVKNLHSIYYKGHVALSPPPLNTQCLYNSATILYGAAIKGGVLLYVAFKMVICLFVLVLPGLTFRRLSTS